MRVLVTGASGMLGREVVAALTESGHTAMPTQRPSAMPRLPGLDVTDPDAVSQTLRSTYPDCVIHCAAFTQVDRAELVEYADELKRTNVESCAYLAGSCDALEIPICTISTDFVFDGEKDSPYIESDRPNPINAYGYSKLLGEHAVQKATDAHWILRTAWLFGEGQCFPSSMLNAAVAGKPLSVVNDQTGCPTYTADLARNLIKVIESAPYGIYHLVNRGQATRHQLACKTVEAAGVEAEITPIRTEDYLTVATRPSYSVLSCEKLDRLGLYEMRPWEEALADYVAERTSGG